MPAGSAISAISSSAAVGWQDQMATLGELLATNGFDEAVAWLQAHEESWSWSGYLFSKWVGRRVGRLVVSRPRRSGHPDQLHQPRSHRHRDDAGVPRLRHQGSGRPSGRAHRSIRTSRRASLATRHARQSARELHRRRSAGRRRRIRWRPAHRSAAGRLGEHHHRLTRLDKANTLTSATGNGPQHKERHASSRVARRTSRGPRDTRSRARSRRAPPADAQHRHLRI